MTSLRINLTFIGIFTISANIFRLLSFAFLFNRLGGHYFGFFGFAASTYLTLSVILSLGIDLNYVRNVKIDSTNIFFKYTTKIKIIQIIYSFPILTFILLWKGIPLLETVLVIITYSSRIYLNLFIAYFSSLNMRWKASVGDFFRELIFLLVVFVLSSLSLRTYLFSLMICETLGLISVFLLALPFLRTNLTNKSISWKLLFKSVKKIIALQFLSYFNIYLCQIFLVGVELGIFVFINTIVGSLGIIQVILSTSLFPHYVYLSTKKPNKVYKEMVNQSIFLILIGFLLVLATILSLEFSFIRDLLKSFGINPKIYNVIVILSIWYILIIITTPINRFYLVTKHDSLLLMAMFVSLMIQTIILIHLPRTAFFAGFSLVSGSSVSFMILWIIFLIKYHSDKSESHNNNNNNNNNNNEIDQNLVI